jgi:hypothetical protein
LRKCVIISPVQFWSVAFFGHIQNRLFYWWNTFDRKNPKSLWIKRSDIPCVAQKIRQIKINKTDRKMQPTGIKQGYFYWKSGSFFHFSIFLIFIDQKFSVCELQNIIVLVITHHFSESFFARNIFTQIINYYSNV